MALDPKYIPASTFLSPQLDKTTGLPMSYGVVKFWHDSQRLTPKDVYKLTGTAGSYSFVSLGAELTLGVAGTFVDGFGNQFVPYFYPYAVDGITEDLYYVEVENQDGLAQYTLQAVPDIGAGITPSSSAGAYSNEMSNPQFAQVLFDTSSGPYVYTITAGSTTINIAPDWVIEVTSGAGGTLTVEQVTPAGSLNIVTNPASILTISSTGLTAVRLRQRITGSPNLWGNGSLSGSFVAKTFGGSVVPLDMYYSQSNGSVIGELILQAALSGSSYQSYAGSVIIPQSTSTDEFPSAYIDIYFDLPLTAQIGISSVMVAFTEDVVVDNLPYDQSSYERQVDHLYHYAYPIVPVGMIVDYFGFNVPAHYLLCDYTAYNRINYFQLFNTITTTETVTLTLGLATFTVSVGTAANYRVGMGLEGVGIPAQSTITSVVGTTITMTQVATGAGPTVVRFFAAGNIFTQTALAGLTFGNNTFTVNDVSNLAVGMSLIAFGVGTISAQTRVSNISAGPAPFTITMSANASATGAAVMYFYSPANGDGITTFNVPDARRRSLIGSGGTVVSGSPLGIGNQLGNVGGEEAHVQLAAEVGAHTHPTSFIASSPSGTVVNGAGVAWYNSSSTVGANTPAGTAFNIIQPGLVTNKCIRYE